MERRDGQAVTAEVPLARQLAGVADWLVHGEQGMDTAAPAARLWTANEFLGGSL